MLAEEMRSWADNIEEKFGATQKYETVSECADILEGIDMPAAEMTSINNHKITWQDPKPTRRAKSRASRCAEACDMLRAAEEKLRELHNELPENNPDHDAAAGVADEVENMISELENVEFPGMFG